MHAAEVGVLSRRDRNREALPCHWRVVFPSSTVARVAFKEARIKRPILWSCGELALLYESACTSLGQPGVCTRHPSSICGFLCADVAPLTSGCKGLIVKRSASSAHL